MIRLCVAGQVATTAEERHGSCWSYSRDESSISCFCQQDSPTSKAMCEGEILGGNGRRGSVQSRGSEMWPRITHLGKELRAGTLLEVDGQQRASNADMWRARGKGERRP